MKIRQLLEHWHSAGGHPSAKTTLTIELPVHDAARLFALATMFPALKTEEITASLIHSALDEVQEAFPYVNGSKQVGEDEVGNPIYEDIGHTPQFLALVQQYLDKVEPS